MPNLRRCPWCPADDELYIAYHDDEWGVPVRDGRLLFEMLNLEGAQAGLSWRTVLAKRARYREVFENFDPAKLSRWSDAKIARALKDPGIIRNRLKVESVRRNARALLAEFGDVSAFADFLWTFEPAKPGPVPKVMSDYKARTDESDAMSKALRKRGFNFVGSTICYAFMQAVGIVNDHSASCFRRPAIAKAANR
jgi:DNA-3-methyladenine glycosylase I